MSDDLFTAAERQKVEALAARLEQVENGIAHVEALFPAMRREVAEVRMAYERLVKREPVSANSGKQAPNGL